MRKITIREYRKYTDIINKLDNELGRIPPFEEFAYEAGLQEKMEIAKEIFRFITEDAQAPSADSNEYELIIRRGLGNNELKKMRVKMNLTQKELADKIGCGSATVTSWENCRAYPPKKFRVKLSEMFKCEEENLFPEWLKFVADEMKNAETERVVEVGKLSLNSPELLMLESENPLDTEKILNKIRGAELFKKAQAVLNPRELKFLKLRFGFENGAAHTLEETAEEFGVTRERVRQIEAKALDKIRDSL